MLKMVSNLEFYTPGEELKGIVYLELICRPFACQHFVVVW